MRSSEQVVARRQIDRRLSSLKDVGQFTRPPRGWVKAIREALGMTTRQLGERIGVSQPRAVTIEKAEVDGSITLASLERAAGALDCQLVYVLVPRRPLEELVDEQARAIARARLARTGHSMALEGQRVTSEDVEYQVAALAQEIVASAGSKLWESS